MLRFMFPRLFGQFPETALITGKFLVSNSGATLTPTSTGSGGESHPLLSASGDSGQYVVTLSGGAKVINVVGVHASLMDLDDPTDARLVFVDEETGINESAGTIPLTVITNGTDTAGTGGSPAITDLPDGAVLTITLCVKK